MRGESIRIGYCLSLSGPLSANSRSAQLAHRIWQDGVNAEGGLLGRPVELICHDDRGDASLVPGLYEELIEEEGVDLVMGGYGTNSLLSAMPLMIERRRFFVGLMGLGVNNTFGYDGYFAMIPTGPEPNSALTEGFFALAAEQIPKPSTVAFLSADAEFSRNPIIGARINADRFGLKIVHNATYALSTRDFLPLITEVSKSECDVLFLCSYLADTIGLIRAIRAHRFRPKMVGGAMIGPQSAQVKVALGPLLNGIVNYEYWVPSSKMMFRGVQDLLTHYQARAAEADVDPLGHYMAPLAYAQMQVLAQAIEGTGSVDDARLAKFARDASFDTVMGPVRFGANGEWREPRVLQVQFTGITDHDLGQFRNGSRQVVVSPSSFASERLLYPYDEGMGPA